RLGEPEAPNGCDLYLLRDDMAKQSGFGSPAGAARRFFGGDDGSLLLSATEEGLLVALPAGRSPGQFHFTDARHGHTLKLIPDPLLLEPPSGGAQAGFAGLPGPSVVLSEDERDALSLITGDALLGLVERYSGLRPLSPKTQSRFAADTSLIAAAATAER